MTTPRYPLIERLGLKHTGYTALSQDAWVSADDLERILSEAPVVTGYDASGAFVWSDCSTSDDTHTALLIGIAPIAKPDSFESLVREYFTLEGSTVGSGRYQAWAERAKKLLAKREGGE